MLLTVGFSKAKENLEENKARVLVLLALGTQHDENQKCTWDDSAAGNSMCGKGG